MNYSFIIKTLTEILFKFKIHKVLNLLQINKLLSIKLDNINNININNQNEPIKQSIKIYLIII